MAKQKVLWGCAECGHRQTKWTGSCSVCQKWNTFSEEVEIEEKHKRFDLAGKPTAQPMRVKEVSTTEFRRHDGHSPHFRDDTGACRPPRRSVAAGSLGTDAGGAACEH